MGGERPSRPVGPPPWPRGSEGRHFGRVGLPCASEVSLSGSGPLHPVFSSEGGVLPVEIRHAQKPTRLCVIEVKSLCEAVISTCRTRPGKASISHLC
jgi:hypothetical protein